MQFLRPTNIALGSIDAEVNDKVTSLTEPADRTKRHFLQVCEEQLLAEDRIAVEKAIAWAESLPSRDPNHPAMSAYFAHPLRVATFTLRLATKPAKETIELGLIHNVFEVSGLDETELVRAGFSQRQADGIRLLTIDRKHQYDPEYLVDFYKKIENFGQDLVLVKCVDRLDNLLAFDVIERSDKIIAYLDLTEQFVIPMATRLSQDLGNYLSSVLIRVQTTACNQELRAQYEAFLKNAVKEH